jgi:hypothetical protein
MVNLTQLCQSKSGKSWALLFAGLKPAGGKQFMRPYLEKTHHRKVAQGVQTPVNKTKLRFFYQFFFFSFFDGSGDFSFANRCCTPPVHFALVTLEIGGSCELFAQAGLNSRSSRSQPPK